MKRFLYTILFLSLSTCAFSQTFIINSQYKAIDTNGPIGECLFPCNEEGKIFFQEIVLCNASKEKIETRLNDWANDVNSMRSNRFKANDIYSSENVFSFKGQAYIGNTAIGIPFVGGVIKHYSEVSYNCKIDIRENKYRITLTNFYTQRVTLRGEAKSDGESNILHWQRINSLKKEREDADKDKEKLEYDKRIAAEEEIYKEEYAAILKIIDELKNCIELEDF